MNILRINIKVADETVNILLTKLFKEEIEEYNPKEDGDALRNLYDSNDTRNTSTITPIVVVKEIKTMNETPQNTYNRTYKSHMGWKFITPSFVIIIKIKKPHWKEVEEEVETEKR